MHSPLWCQLDGNTSSTIYIFYVVASFTIILENVEHCGGEHEQAANMHMNRLSFTLK